jgi:hypothetical protein
MAGMDARLDPTKVADTCFFRSLSMTRALECIPAFEVDKVSVFHPVCHQLPFCDFIVHLINVPLSCIRFAASFSSRIPAASCRHASPTTTATGMTAKSTTAIARQKSAM